MNRCIYLKETEPEVTFEKQEHIISAGIGGVRMLDKGMVSDEFNNTISSLELDFMRNSPISIPRQFLGPGKRGSLSEKKASKSNIHIVSANGDFSDASLGYIKLGKPHQIPQFKIMDNVKIQIIFDQSDGDYKVQLLNFIEDLKSFEGKYNTIVDNKIQLGQVLLGKFKEKWYLGIHNQDNNPPLMEYVNKLINEKSILSERPNYGKTHVVSGQSMVFNIESYFRVCAKIIFNFLAFSHGADFVLQEKFDSIREWIVNGGENKFANLIDKKNENKSMTGKIYYPDQAHKITIIKKNNQLLGIIDFYGESFETIVLLCDNFMEPYDINCYICDWKNKKEYTLMEYVRFLTGR